MLPILILSLLLVYGSFTSTVYSAESEHPYIVLTTKPYFVDKSEFLIMAFENYTFKHLYFTTPKRFGRTSNLDMIDIFANIELDSSSLQSKNYTETVSYQLFNGSKFGQHLGYRYILDLHSAQHPVIYLNLGSSLPKNFSIQSMIKYLLYALQKSFKRYEWLLKLPSMNKLDCGPDRVISREDIDFVDKLLKGRVNQGGVENSLKILSRILHRYFDREVIILIDSFDHAFSHALFYSKVELQSDSEMFEAFMVINRMVSNAVRYLPYTKSFMTGLSHAAIDSDHLGCVAHYSFLEYSRFTGHFGYTEEEVDHLLINNSCSMPERNEVVRYYNGHRVEDGETKLFSPYSITKYMENRIKDTELFQAGLKPYFFADEKTSPILKFIPIPVFRHNLISLVNRKAISFCPVIHFQRVHYEHYFLLRNNNFTFAGGYSESFVQSLLLTMILKMGYLCYDRDRNFTLPNTEIERYLNDALDTFYAPANDTFYRIGSLVYGIILTEDDSQKESLIRDLESEMNDLFGRLSTIYEHKRIFELEYRYVTNKAIKKYQLVSKDRGNVWTSGSQFETILITSRSNNKTTAGVLQMSCSHNATKVLAKAMKSIKPRTGNAPLTYFGISIDQRAKVSIETSTTNG